MWHLTRELNKLGHNVTVLTSSYHELRGWANENGVNVYRCASLRKNRATSNIFEMLCFIISATIMLPGIIKKQRIQGNIIFFLFPCGPLGLILHYLFKLPFIVSFRGGDVPGADAGLNWLHQVLKPVRRKIYDKSVRIVANTKWLKKIANKQDAQPIQVIPNGIDADVYFPSAKPERTSHPFKILFVGRFKPEKNLAFMVTQIAKLQKECGDSFIVHMVGDGTEKTNLMNLILELGISDRFVWYGWLEKPKLVKLYQNSDCLILPSLYEGMSNVILEAMACGLPVIASRTGGNEELVDDNHTGLLFELEKENHLSFVLKKLMNTSHLAMKYGANARKSVVEKYNWNAVAREYMHIFQTRKKQC